MGWQDGQVHLSEGFIRVSPNIFFHIEKKRLLSSLPRNKALNTQKKKKPKRNYLNTAHYADRKYMLDSEKLNRNIFKS